jgi:polysaccharide biosynthesis transport protein
MESTEQDLMKYARLILKNKRLYFAVAASIMAAFVIAGYLLPKTYEAKCTVLIVKSVYDDYVKGIAIAPSGEQNLGGLSSALTGKSLILKVIRELGLVMDTMSPEEEEEAVGMFRSRTTMKIPSSKANPKMINQFVVSYRDTNPEFARDYVNTLVRRFIEEDLTGKDEDTSEARLLLSGQVGLFKNKIDAIEAEIVRFKMGENAYVVSDEAKINEKLIALQNRLGELSVKYTDDYPEVIAARTEIKHLQDQLTYLRTRSVVDKNRSTAQGGSGRTVEDTNRKLADLERERDTYKKIYEELIIRLSKSEVSQQIGSLDRSELFNLSEPAVLPTKPVSPDRVKVILMGIFAGLAGGIGIIVLLDAMDHSVKSSKTIRALGLPILAIIPKIQSDRQLQRERTQNGIFYCLAGLYMLGVLAIVAIEAMGLPYADTFAQQSLVAIKASVKGVF